MSGEEFPRNLQTVLLDYHYIGKGLHFASVTLLNSEVLYNSFFFIADESSSDENAHDVGDEKTMCQESNSNKDIGHDINGYQLQNRSTFYSTGEKHLTAFYDV